MGKKTLFLGSNDLGSRRFSGNLMRTYLDFFVVVVVVVKETSGIGARDLYVRFRNVRGVLTERYSIYLAF